MVKPVNIGVKTFHELIESNSCYADKTPFIRTVFKDIASKVLLITRPRRFGKTLTLSTFYDFLVLNPENPGDVSRQENWFRGTGIFSDREFCRDYMGRFPVIFLSLQSVASDNFNDSYNQLAHAVYLLAGNFSYLESSSELNDHEIAQFKDLLNCSKLQDQSDKTALTNALLTLTDLLYRHHKINPVLLIDDYDTPLIKAARYGYYHDMVNVFFPFLSAGLRGNPHLKKAVVTGCLRAVMDLNNFQNSTVLDSGHKKLAAGIGFESLFHQAHFIREMILDMTELTTGGRLITSVNKIGGVRRDIDADMAKAVLISISRAQLKMTIIIIRTAAAIRTISACRKPCMIWRIRS